MTHSIILDCLIRSLRVLVGFNPNIVGVNIFKEIMTFLSYRSKQLFFMCCVWFKVKELFSQADHALGLAETFPAQIDLSTKVRVPFCGQQAAVTQWWLTHTKLNHAVSHLTLPCPFSVLYHRHWLLTDLDVFTSKSPGWILGLCRGPTFNFLCVFLISKSPTT